MVNHAESVKNIEELYNITRVNQEKRLNKISKQLEVLNVTIRKINSTKKQSPTSTVLDKVLSGFIIMSECLCYDVYRLLFRGFLLWRKSSIISLRY